MGIKCESFHKAQRGPGRQNWKRLGKMKRLGKRLERFGAFGKSMVVSL